MTTCVLLLFFLSQVCLFYLYFSSIQACFKIKNIVAVLGNLNEGHNGVRLSPILLPTIIILIFVVHYCHLSYPMNIEENIFLNDILSNLSKWHILPSNVMSYFMDVYCNVV